TWSVSCGPPSTTTPPTARIGRWRFKPQRSVRDWLSSPTISRPKSTDAICSAVSCTSTGELHEHLCAPHRVYIHQLPQTAPRVAGLIEDVFGPAARGAQVMPTVSAGRRVEGN